MDHIGDMKPARNLDILSLTNATKVQQHMRGAIEGVEAI